MTQRLLTYLLIHLRPREGWLPLLLLFGAAGCLVWSVLGVGWVPEDGIVIPAALLGLLLGVVLAKRPLSPLPAWLLLTAYGLLVNLLWLARLWPPWGFLLGEWELLRRFWIQRGAVFLDRLLGWLQAVLSGESSQETLSFALGLGLLSWFLAAYVGWATYREKRPLNALLIMGTALAVNGYYGAAPYFPTALFVAQAALLAALLHFDNLQQQWDKRLVDYSTQIRFDLLTHAGLIALLLLTLAYLLPVFNPSQIARALLQQPAIVQTEQALERMFGGVRPPVGGEVGTAPGSPGGPGGAGILPRAYLLGNAPELSETVVMTATVSWSGPPPPDRVRLERWRALTYDVYTGRGWAISEERTETVPPFDPIPLPAITEPTTISQTVHWLFDARLIRYTVGQPLWFDQATTSYWRGQTDLARVVRGREEGQVYTAVSRHTNTPAAALRTAPLDQIDPVILGRYTNLPANLPERVGQLAQEIAGDQPTPYDQARALVAFLNQYPYTLDVGVPPAGRDVVDYFLFEAQTGYCDYYASAMVVMARSLGLPARLVVGYLSPPPDEAGVTTVRQIESHSWAEIYFAGYGWVEFEPTRPFAPGVDDGEEETAVLPPTLTDDPDPTPTPPPLPEPDPAGTIWSGWLVGLLTLGLVGLLGWAVWLGWQAEQGLRREGVVWVYGRLQHHIYRWGQSIPPQQTPAEFEQALKQRLDEWATSPRRQQVADRLRPLLVRLTALYNETQYGGRAQPSSQTTRTLWQGLRRPLWWLRFWGWVDRRRG